MMMRTLSLIEALDGFIPRSSLKLFVIFAVVSIDSVENNSLTGKSSGRL
jgi:hypothetical protein